MSDDTPTGIRGVLPEPAKASARRGGTHSHKPGCQCRPCAARTRDEETKSSTTGGGELALVSAETAQEGVVIADEPVVRPSKAKRAIIAEWVRLRGEEPEITNTQVAERLKINRNYLQRCIQTATQEGWLVHDDPLSRLDYEIVPKVLDNLSFFLDAKDRLVTVEMAKGTVLKSYQEAKGMGAGQQTVLALKIELPTTDTAQMEIVEGQIIGVPKLIAPVEKN